MTRSHHACGGPFLANRTPCARDSPLPGGLSPSEGLRVSPNSLTIPDDWGTKGVEIQPCQKAASGGLALSKWMANCIHYYHDSP